MIIEDSVNSYLDLALTLANETGDSAILKYAIKALRYKNMSIAAKKLLTQRVMHMSVIYPYLIQMMEEYIFTPLSVEDDQIKKYADVLYAESKKTHNYEGICYAIYFCLKHNVLLHELDIDWVIDRKDCIMLLMTWIYYLKVNHGKKKATELKPLRDAAKRLKDTEINRYWLFCYEVLSFDDLKGEWKEMKKAKVSFVKPVL